MKNNEKKFKRKCISCGEFKEKTELIKITKTSDNNIVLNPNSKEFGHSFYICNCEECIKNALKKGRINKLLKQQLPQEIIDKLTF